MKVHVVGNHALFILRIAVPDPLHERPGRRATSILVIEDDEAVRGLFRAILEPVGYLIQEASTGWEGIRRFRESPTDLVMTDMDMPHGDGVDVIRELRADYPSVKILAVSGSKQPDEFSEALRLGAVAMLGKPFGAHDLREAVVHCLSGPTGKTP
jgi:CheY-like chemotaxis protein